jgi:hypothetical protein
MVSLVTQIAIDSRNANGCLNQKETLEQSDSNTSYTQDDPPSP